MKKFLLLNFYLLSATAICYSQATHTLDKDTAKYKNSPLYIIKVPQQPAQLSTNLVIVINDIDSVSVHKSEESVKLYGKAAINGSIEIRLKPGSALINFERLLTAFEIPVSNINLPVFIDSAIAYQPKNTFFEPAAIKYVKIERETETG